MKSGELTNARAKSNVTIRALWHAVNTQSKNNKGPSLLLKNKLKRFE